MLSQVEIEVVKTTDLLKYLIDRMLLSVSGTCFNIVIESESLTEDIIRQTIIEMKEPLMKSEFHIYVLKHISDITCSKDHFMPEVSDKNWITIILSDHELLDQSNTILSIPFFGDGHSDHIKKIIGQIVFVNKKQHGGNRSEIFTPKITFVKN